MGASGWQSVVRCPLPVVRCSSVFIAIYGFQNMWPYLLLCLDCKKIRYN